MRTEDGGVCDVFEVYDATRHANELEDIGEEHTFAACFNVIIGPMLRPRRIRHECATDNIAGPIYSRNGVDVVHAPFR